MSDRRLTKLLEVLQYFSNWKQGTSDNKEFISDKLWFDVQSMILGFRSMVKTKLTRFPGTCIKPAIVNQDVLENHFSQLRGANAQNDNPSYRLVQATQNSVILGQATISKKCNTGQGKNALNTCLPNGHVFGKERRQNKETKRKTPGLLFDENLFTER